MITRWLIPHRTRQGALDRCLLPALAAGLLAVASGDAAGDAAGDQCSPVGASVGEQRVAAINWGLTQTLIALEITPVAVADAPGYRKWVARPALPASSVDIGRRIEPSLAVLTGSRPDVIAMSSFYDELQRELARIAPVLNLDIYLPDSEPLPRAHEVASCLARRFGRQAALRRLEQRLDTSIAGLAAAVQAAGAHEAVYVVQFRDAGHVRVYGDNSLFDGVLERTGLDNAWQGPTNFWGFSTTAFTALDNAAGRLIVVNPVPREAQAMMAESPIWRALPAVRDGRVHRIPAVWAYGGLTSAIRFAELLEEEIRGGL